jgi:hypothetical protein
MARLAYEARTKVHFLASLIDEDAPALTEIAAGVDLTTFITKDGVNPGTTNNRIDTGGIDDTFDSQIQGSWGAEFQLTAMRDDAVDTAWETLQRSVQGYIIVGYDSAAGIAVGDVVQVWPVELGTPVMQPSAANTNQMFVADCAIATPPVLEATVVAFTT